MSTFLTSLSRLIPGSPDGEHKLSCAIVDLDGTLSDATWRRKQYLEQPKPDWKSFLNQFDRDPPNQHVVFITNLIKQAGHKVIICSGRHEWARRKTNQWLHDHGVEFDILMLREDKDSRTDWIVKREMLEVIRVYYRPFVAIDDRPSVVAMWRAEGIPVLVCDQEGWQHDARERELMFPGFGDGRPSSERQTEGLLPPWNLAKVVSSGDEEQHW